MAALISACSSFRMHLRGVGAMCEDPDGDIGGDAGELDELDAGELDACELDALGGADVPGVRGKGGGSGGIRLFLFSASKTSGAILSFKYLARFSS
jgi:hypothetical protein